MHDFVGDEVSVEKALPIWTCEGPICMQAVIKKITYGHSPNAF